MRQRLSVIFFVITILWIALVFYFSTRFPNESAKQASFVYNFFKKLDRIFDFSETTLFVKVRMTLNRLWFGTHRATGIEFIRKSAHFGLYMFLGCFSFLFGILYTQKILAAILIGASFPALVASLDEYSQQFFQRGASLNDVIIDISGAIFGVLVCTIVYFAVTAIRALIKKISQSTQL